MLDPDGAIAGSVQATWEALTSGDGRTVRKILAFVASRAQCDELAGLLKRNLSALRDIRVFAHHGSLDKALREKAESGFAAHRDVVLVATSTLEVGVDIGDVDAVVLVGAPPDTNALLQRIGRFGRRSGMTRVVALARSEAEARILGSMLVAARDGLLDDQHYAPRWSVFVQQAASYVRQNGGLGRRTEDVIALADIIAPDQGQLFASRTINHLISGGCPTT